MSERPIFIPLPPNTTRVSVGDTLPFMFRGHMTPFEITAIHGNHLKLRSCDLKWVNECRVDFWLKQKTILEEENDGNKVVRAPNTEELSAFPEV